MDNRDLTVLIPARNENDSLRIVIPALFAWCRDVNEIIIVVDSPSDSTFEIMNDSNLMNYPFRIIINSGFGIAGAINSGVNHARSGYIGVCMADEVMPLVNLNQFLTILRSGIPYVSATRYSQGGGRYGGSRIGHLLSWTANRMFRLYSKGEMSDATTGIKFFEKDIWPIIGHKIEYKGWAPALAISLNALKSGIQTSEVPIISLDRPVGGLSTFKVSSWVPAYLRAFVMTK